MTAARAPPNNGPLAILMKRSKQPRPDPRRLFRITAAAIFALALVVRISFGLATPDWHWPASGFYKADAYTWLAYAQALQQHHRFELGLPLRPPGMAYLVAWLWNGQQDAIPLLKLAWCLLGALTVLLFYTTVLRDFGFAVAGVAALLGACSTGLLILSTSLNNETPYLLLVVAALALCQPLVLRPRTALIALWSVLNALACLVRVEHALLFGLASIYLASAWVFAKSPRSPLLASLARLAFSALVFALVLLPWQLIAWQEVRRFNTQPPDNAADNAVQERLEQVLAGRIHWSRDGLAARAALPAFCRRLSSNFVAATAAWRGDRTVTAADFQILEQAFGSRPEPLAAHPFITNYGPLNFYLANNRHARGGFSRGPLDDPPLLLGGPARYPSVLIQGLPPLDLSLVYPPHLAAFNHGYRLGWQWIRRHPADALQLALVKLQIFWAGAALGFTGYDLPLGLSGLRRTADLVVPQGGLVSLWRVALLALCVAGVAAGRKRAALIPWLLLFASKAVVTLAFFGYARQGAALAPVVYLLAALAARRWIPALERLADLQPGKLTKLVLCAALLIAGLEAVRWIHPPAVLIDGQRIGAVDPIPVDQHRDHILELR